MDNRGLIPTNKSQDAKFESKYASQYSNIRSAIEAYFFANYLLDQPNTSIRERERLTTIARKVWTDTELSVGERNFLDAKRKKLPIGQRIRRWVMSADEAVDLCYRPKILRKAKEAKEKYNKVDFSQFAVRDGDDFLYQHKIVHKDTSKTRPILLVATGRGCNALFQLEFLLDLACELDVDIVHFAPRCNQHYDTITFCHESQWYRDIELVYRDIKNRSLEGKVDLWGECAGNVMISHLAKTLAEKDKDNLPHVVHSRTFKNAVIVGAGKAFLLVKSLFSNNKLAKLPYVGRAIRFVGKVVGYLIAAIAYIALSLFFYLSGIDFDILKNMKDYPKLLVTGFNINPSAQALAEGYREDETIAWFAALTSIGNKGFGGIRDELGSGVLASQQQFGHALSHNTPISWLRHEKRPLSPHLRNRIHRGPR